MDGICYDEQNGHVNSTVWRNLEKNTRESMYTNVSKTLNFGELICQITWDLETFIFREYDSTHSQISLHYTTKLNFLLIK